MLSADRDYCLSVHSSESQTVISSRPVRVLAGQYTMDTTTHHPQQYIVQSAVSGMRPIGHQTHISKRDGTIFDKARDTTPAHMSRELWVVCDQSFRNIVLKFDHVDTLFWNFKLERNHYLQCITICYLSSNFMFLNILGNRRKPWSRLT